MRIAKLGMTASLAAAALFAASCGRGNVGECETDDDCESGFVCHTGAAVCVASCETEADCEDARYPSCAAIPGTTDTLACLCSESSCGEGQVCSTTLSVCLTTCTTDSNCGSGEVCDTESGTCVPGTPAGTECSNTKAQPDVCAYGEYCNASNTCADVALVSTCANFSSHGATFNPTTSTGPVIYEVTKKSYAADAAFCGAGNPTRVQVTVKAYSKDADFPATDATLESGTGPFGLHYVLENGSEGEVAITGYTRSGKTATFTMNFCRPTDSTTFGFAAHFVSGNEVCGQFNK